MYANYILVHTLRCWRIVQTGTDGMYINHVERSVHTYVIRVLTTVVCAVHYPRNVPCRRAEIESHKSFHNKKNQAKEVPSTTILLRSSAYTWYLVCHFDCRATNWTQGVWEWGVPAQLQYQRSTYLWVRASRAYIQTTESIRSVLEENWPELLLITC